ncbi:MAG TPA: DctP family TRAP transporter solute-binding subunit [Limnochordales bacterium]
MKGSAGGGRGLRARLAVGLAGLVALAGGVAGAAWTARAESPAAPAGLTREVRLRVGHIATANSLYQQDAEDFKRLVEQRSGGRIRVDVFCCGQLGRQRELVEQVQLGTLEMVVSSSEMVGIVPEFAVWDLPFLFDSREEIQRAVEGPFGAALFRYLEPKGMVGLGFWENGFRVMTNNQRPIRRPEDLRGLKMRVPPNPDRVRMFRLWGANAGPLDFSELFSALQTGVFDGQENPLAQIVSARLYEVQKFLSVTGHVYTPTYLVASRRWWERLEPAARQLLRETAVEVGRNSRQRGVQWDRDGLNVVQRAGVQVNKDVDKEAFRRLSGPLYDDFTSKYGRELLNLAQAH